MSTPNSPQSDPQTHLDSDPTIDPAHVPAEATQTGSGGDRIDDPAHDTGEDEGWTSEGGSTPDGPATDT